MADDVSGLFRLTPRSLARVLPLRKWSDALRARAFAPQVCLPVTPSELSDFHDGFDTAARLLRAAGLAGHP